MAVKTENDVLPASRFPICFLSHTHVGCRRTNAVRKQTHAHTEKTPTSDDKASVALKHSFLSLSFVLVRHSFPRSLFSNQYIYIHPGQTKRVSAVSTLALKDVAQRFSVSLLPLASLSLSLSVSDV